MANSGFIGLVLGTGHCHVLSWGPICSLCTYGCRCYDISWPLQQNYPPCSIQQSYQDAATQARPHRKKQEIWIWYNLLLKLDIPKLRNCARAQHIANSWICFILVVYLLKESNSKPNWSMNISQTSNYFKEPSKRWQLIRYGYFHHYFQILKWNIFSLQFRAFQSTYITGATLLNLHDTLC